MVSREIWEKHALMSFSKTQIEQILYVFEKLTRACFSQIALETILLPIPIHRFNRNNEKYMSYIQIRYLIDRFSVTPG